MMGSGFCYRSTYTYVIFFVPTLHNEAFRYKQGRKVQSDRRILFYVLNDCIHSSNKPIYLPIYYMPISAA